MQNTVSLRKSTDAPETYDAGVMRRYTAARMFSLARNSLPGLSDMFFILDPKRSNVSLVRDVRLALFR